MQRQEEPDLVLKREALQVEQVVIVLLVQD